MEKKFKCDCIISSINFFGVRKTFLYSLALDEPPGKKTYKKPRTKLCKRMNKSVLSHITFYLEDHE